jgi:hypothetical protein
MRAEETVGWSLIALGNTFDAVAKTLNCTGIQGVRNTVRILNPIVRYLQARFPNAMVVDVIRGDAVHIVYRDGSEDMTPLPLPVREFLDAFDSGAYPELEIPPPVVNRSTI